MNRVSKNSLAESIAKFVIARPWSMIVLALLIVFALGSGAKNLQFNTNYRVFFTESNPQLEAFDEIEQVYTKTDNIFFTIRPKSGTVFQPEVLRLLQEMTEESWRLPFSQRVDSLSNYQHTTAFEDDLIVADLVEGDPFQYGPEQISAIEQVALNEPLLLKKLISTDSRTTGINVIVNLPGKDMFEVPKAAMAARALVQKYKEKYPNIEIRPSGVSLMNDAFMSSSMRDMTGIVPIMYLTLLVAMLIFLRSITATLATLVVIIFSAACAMGFGGWMGFPLTPPSAITPTVVLTLAIADSIHIILSMIKAMHHGMAKREAIIESLRINLQPVFLTSVTTMIGFLSLNFSEAPPFWHLGNMTAAGIGMAFVFSIFLLPAILSILPMKVKVYSQEKRPMMENFGAFVVRFRKPLLVLSLALTGFFTVMMSRIELNDQFVQYFDHSIAFRGDTEFMVDNLSGIYNVEYSVSAQRENGVTEPEYLNNLEQFTQWLRSQEEVDHVYSVTDIFKRLNKNMHGDDQTWYKIPENSELAAQYLLLYEFSLPYGLDLTDRIDVTKSSSRLSVTLKDISTNQIRAFKNKSEQWLKDNTPEYMHTEATSPIVMFSYISQRNIQSMMKGNLLSLLLISLCIMLALRSFKIGLFSLVPNLAPIALGYGLWGLLIGQINMAVAIAAAVSLGIIVDDTVHFLSKYQRARREKGLDSHAAVKYAFSTVGSALFVTTLVLLFGFGVLSQSAFQMNSYLGLLTAFVIASALFADFFLLPPMMMWIERKRKGTAKMNKTIAACLALMIGLPSASFAATKEELLASGDAAQKGWAIAKEVDARDTGFQDQVSNLRMVLRNAYGQETTRQMKVRTFERADQSVGDLSLISFDNPRDVKGTALLSHAKILEADDQWLYLPALKRVKRISSKNKSGPFMGSEFAFEDITANEIGKYNWEYLGLETVDGMECFKLKTTPKYEHSGYTKRLVWVDTEHFRGIKIEYYDRKDELLKTQTFHDYKQYLDQFWRADRWSMSNHQTGKNTDLVYSDYVFRSGLTEQDFNQGALRRVK